MQMPDPSLSSMRQEDSSARAPATEFPNTDSGLRGELPKVPSKAAGHAIFVLHQHHESRVADVLESVAAKLSEQPQSQVRIFAELLGGSEFLREGLEVLLNDIFARTKGTEYAPPADLLSIFKATVNDAYLYGLVSGLAELTRKHSSVTWSWTDAAESTEAYELREAEHDIFDEFGAKFSHSLPKFDELNARELLDDIEASQLEHLEAWSASTQARHELVTSQLRAANVGGVADTIDLVFAGSTHLPIRHACPRSNRSDLVLTFSPDLLKRLPYELQGQFQPSFGGQKALKLVSGTPLTSEEVRDTVLSQCLQIVLSTSWEAPNGKESFDIPTLTGYVLHSLDRETKDSLYQSLEQTVTRAQQTEGGSNSTLEKCGSLVLKEWLQSELAQPESSGTLPNRLRRELLAGKLSDIPDI
jgi:hypothetical protein